MPEKQVSGRTPWDFTTELLGVLGRLGPSAIIVAGFLIFAYFFYQELTKARLETDQQLQQRLETAQKQLIETYEKMGGMSNQLIQNIQSLMELNANIDKNVETNRNKLAELEKKTQKEIRDAKDRVALATREERERAQKEIRAAKAEVALAQEKLENANNVSLAFLQIKQNISEFLVRVYMPRLSTKVVRDKYTLFVSEDSLSLGVMQAFVKSLLKKNEQVREEFLGPVLTQERELLKSMLSGNLQDEAMEKLQMLSLNIEKFVESTDFEKVPDNELLRSLGVVTKDLEILVKTARK